MATLEKQKRRSFMNFYKSKSKPKNHVPKPAEPMVVTDKPMVSPAALLPRKSYYGDERAKPMVSPAVSLPRKSDYCEETIIKPMMSPMLLPRKSNHGQETADQHDGPRRSIDVGGRRLVAVEGPRKSVSQVETNLASVVAFLQVKVLVTDMPGFMQVHAFRCARTTYDSLEKFSSKHIAYNMKKEFDKVYGPAWHCIVGSSFGSFVTHSTGCFLYFSMEKLYILVFKTKVQKALD